MADTADSKPTETKTTKSQTTEGITTENTDAAQRPKPGLYSDKIANQLDPDNRIRTWLSRYLCADNTSHIEVANIQEAYHVDLDLLKSWEPDEYPVTPEQLAVLIGSVFPTTLMSRDCVSAMGLPMPLVIGLRWKKHSNTTTLSHTVLLKHFEQTKLASTAQRFLYEEQPFRTLGWMWYWFESHPNRALSVNGMYKLYLNSFRHAQPEYHVYSRPNFVKYLVKIVDGAQLVQVSKHHFEVRGVGFVSTKARPVETVLAEMRQTTFATMLASGKIKPVYPQTKFAWEMWNEHTPLLPLPDSIPGPVSDRLNRRGNYPNGPLYIEEPGFPGIDVSMVTRKGVRKPKKKPVVKEQPTMGHVKTGKAEIVVPEYDPKDPSAGVYVHCEDKLNVRPDGIPEGIRLDAVAEAVAEALVIDNQWTTEETKESPQKKRKAGKGKGKQKAG